MTVADTDVLIDFLRGHGLSAGFISAALEQGILRTTTVTRFELLSGARTSRQEQALRQLLDTIPALPLDALAADRAAQVRRELEARGESIGMGDSLIAGIVLQNGGTLVTRNRRHFDRVEGLQLQEL